MYVAKDDPSNVLATDSLQGKTDQKGSYQVKDSKIPAGWVLAAGQERNLSFTFTPNAPALLVYLAHGTKVDPHGESKNFKRNVYTQVGNEAKQLYQTQTAVIYRSTTTDEVTGQVIARGQWTTAAIDSLTAPAKAGYTVTNPNAAGKVVVDATMPEQLADVVFTYVADMQTQNFNYVDQNSKQTVATAAMTGKTDSKASFDAMSKLPDGYKLASGQAAQIDFVFAANKPAINIYVVKMSQAETNHASTNDTVVTHIGANEQSPSLNPSKINLIWKDNQGRILNEVQAPKDYKIDWKTVPATTEVTSSENKETGVLTITFQDKSSEDVTVPVTVKGATAINGVKVKQGAAVPAASGSVNTDPIKQFDFKDVTWEEAPSTQTPGAAIPGVARVNYQDGTYQDVNVTIDVLKVEDGRDHKDNTDIYQKLSYITRYYDSTGKLHLVRHERDIYRIKTTDLADGSVDYTGWETDTNTASEIPSTPAANKPVAKVETTKTDAAAAPAPKADANAAVKTDTAAAAKPVSDQN
jgi:hypothetical protein